MLIQSSALKVSFFLLVQEGGKFIPELEDHDGHPTASKVCTTVCNGNTVSFDTTQRYQRSDDASSPEPSIRSITSTASGSEFTYDSRSPPDSMRFVAWFDLVVSCLC